jgi:hypothetical protein
MWAIIQNNKVINVVVDIDQKDIKKNPEKYVDYSNGWDFNNGIDGGDFFPKDINETAAL